MTWYIPNENTRKRNKKEGPTHKVWKSFNMNIKHQFKNNFMKSQNDKIYDYWIEIWFQLLSWLEKKRLIEGMTCGGRVRRKFRRLCFAYFSPSSSFSSTPMLRWALLILYTIFLINIKVFCNKINDIMKFNYVPDIRI